MKISVFYDHLLTAEAQSGLQRAELLKACREWGISAVEIRYAQLEENGPCIQRELGEAGLRVSCVFGFHDFAQDAPIKRAEAQVDAAARLGASRVLIVPGALDEADAYRMRQCQTREETFSFLSGNSSVGKMKAALKQLCAYAGERGVAVTLEDFDGARHPYSRADQLLWFLQNVPGLGLTLDIGNFVFQDEDVLAAYALLKEYIVHVHCKDRGADPAVAPGRLNRGLLPAAFGQGYLPAKAVLRLLNDQGYDGYLAIEHFGAPDALGFMRASARFIQEALGNPADFACLPEKPGV